MCSQASSPGRRVKFCTCILLGLSRTARGLNRRSAMETLYLIAGGIKKKVGDKWPHMMKHMRRMQRHDITFVADVFLFMLVHVRNMQQTQNQREFTVSNFQNQIVWEVFHSVPCAFRARGEGCSRARTASVLGSKEELQESFCFSELLTTSQFLLVLKKKKTLFSGRLPKLTRPSCLFVHHLHFLQTEF